MLLLRAAAGRGGLWRRTHPAPRPARRRLRFRSRRAARARWKGVRPARICASLSARVAHESCCILIDICIESPFMSVTEAEIAHSAGRLAAGAGGGRPARGSCFPRPGSGWRRSAAAPRGTWLAPTPPPARAAGAGRDRRVPRLRVSGRAAATTGWWPSPAPAPPPRWCGCWTRCEGDVHGAVITGVRDSPVATAADGRRRARLRRRAVGRADPVCHHRADTSAGGAGRSRSARPSPTRPRSRCPGDAARRPRRYRRIVFLGAGWTVGLASEAALKLREAAGAWTESYPAMEYRHGPISAASSRARWCGRSAPSTPPCWRTRPRAGSTVAPTSTARWPRSSWPSGPRSHSLVPAVSTLTTPST